MFVNTLLLFHSDIIFTDKSYICVCVCMYICRPLYDLLRNLCVDEFEMFEPQICIIVYLRI
jgi:hypothetical protein